MGKKNGLSSCFFVTLLLLAALFSWRCGWMNGWEVQVAVIHQVDEYRSHLRCHPLADAVGVCEIHR